MNLGRKIGLVLSATGIGWAISHSVRLQAMDSISDPRWVFYSAAIGSVGTLIYVIAAIWEGKIEMAKTWSSVMGVGVLIFFAVSPPLPTESFWRAAEDDCSP